MTEKANGQDTEPLLTDLDIAARLQLTGSETAIKKKLYRFRNHPKKSLRLRYVPFGKDIRYTEADVEDWVRRVGKSITQSAPTNALKQERQKALMKELIAIGYFDDDEIKAISNYLELLKCIS